MEGVSTLHSDGLDQLGSNPNRSSLSPPDSGNSKRPHNLHGSPRCSDAKVPRIAGATEVAEPDSLGPQCHTGALE